MASGAGKIPAGLELMYDLEKEKVSSPLDAFVLSLHWSVIRTGLRQRSPVNDSEFTERLPQDWSLLSTANTGPTRTITLIYYDPHSARVKYELKVIELTANDMVAVTFFRSPNQASSAGPNEGEEGAGPSSAAASVTRPASNKNSGEDKNSAASTFQIGNFIRVGAFQEGQKKDRATEVYEHADLLETQLYESVMEPLGLRVMGQPPVPGPYDDAATKTNGSSSDTRGSRERDPEAGNDPFFHPGLRRPFPSIPGGLGPLHVPPIGVGGGLGRSDMDPFGGIGQGSLLDPRGFRTPRAGFPGLMPGAHPPGARFDPFGPPNPARPGRGTGGFAVPNPDHERPPDSDYDDMFM